MCGSDNNGGDCGGNGVCIGSIDSGGSDGVDSGGSTGGDGGGGGGGGGGDFISKSLPLHNIILY